MKFGTRVCLKPSNDRGEFEPDRTKSKRNNIAENSFALGHETDNRCKHCSLIESNPVSIFFDNFDE